MDGVYFSVQRNYPNGEWHNLTGLGTLEWCKDYLANERKYYPHEGPWRIVEKINNEIYDVVPGTEDN